MKRRAGILGSGTVYAAKRFMRTELARVQTEAQQIRLIQNNDKMLVDKIQTAVLSTIPLWKSQIVIALGLHRQEKVLEMQQSVSEATNTLLTKNAELLGIEEQLKRALLAASQR